jgi:glutamate/tyrosine decarboxylase-like PLP-dependent enzyme
MEKGAQGGAAAVPATRSASIEMDPEEFRRIGHGLIDRLADLLAGLSRRAVTTGESPAAIRAILGDGGVPRAGADPAALVDEAATLLFEHSLFNGHPRFWGFITSSAAPIGALADLLAAAVNPNVGGHLLSPAATEIERQTVAWIAELIGYRAGCGGLLVSGGNVANLVGFWVGRRVKAPWDLRAQGLAGGRRLRIYASAETHTWIQKAADLSGLGTDAIRWIPTDHDQRLDAGALRVAIERDRDAGDCPVVAVGTAGTVSTGAVDPLREIAAVCREHDMWFHVDGAYGAPAAVLPEAPDDLHALALADSISIDPHKWLYAPLEAGCVLVRDEASLRDTFSYHPPYYPEAERGEAAPIYYHEFGPQNSRGFRALKVWLGLRQAGRDGYEQMIRDDVALARALYDLAAAHPELEAVTQGLSITTYRYVPADLASARVGGRGPADPDDPVEQHLTRLNRLIAERMQAGGEAFLTHAIVDGRYLLRACVVNFRTTHADIAALVDLTVKLGREADRESRS